MAKRTRSRRRTMAVLSNLANGSLRLSSQDSKAFLDGLHPARSLFPFTKPKNPEIVAHLEPESQGPSRVSRVSSTRSPHLRAATSRSEKRQRGSRNRQGAGLSGTK